MPKRDRNETTMPSNRDIRSFFNKDDINDGKRQKKESLLKENCEGNVNMAHTGLKASTAHGNRKSAKSAGGEKSVMATIPRDMPMSRPTLPSLTAEQEAISLAHPMQSALVVAGAGTGKTRTICARAMHLLMQGIPWDRILLITFSRKAAMEMNERLRLYLQVPMSARVGVPPARTVHSLCHEILSSSFSTAGFIRQPSIITSKKEKESIMTQCLQAVYEPRLLNAVRTWLGIAQKAIPILNDGIVESIEWEQVVQEAIRRQIKLPEPDTRLEPGSTDKEKSDPDGITADSFDDRLRIYRATRELVVKDILGRNRTAQGAREPLPRDFASEYKKAALEVRNYIEFVHYAKVRDIDPAEYGQTAEADLYKRYQAALLRRNLVDYEDILQKCSRVLDADDSLRDRRSELHKFILVDELQDLNPAQMKILSKLRPDGSGITAVGDDDQAIYGFRGAGSRINFDMMAAEFVKKPLATKFPLCPTGSFVDVAPCKNVAPAYRILGENYRSTPNILNFAGRIISQGRGRLSKPPLKPSPTKKFSPDHANVHVYEFGDEEGEAKFIVDEIERRVKRTRERRWSDFAILFRCMRLGSYLSFQCLQQELQRRLIPFRIQGATGVGDDAFVRIAVDLLKICSTRQGEEDGAFKSCLLELVTGMGQKTLDSMRAAMKASPRQCTEEYVRAYFLKRGRGARGDRVREFIRRIDDAREQIPGLALRSSIELIFSLFIGASEKKDVKKKSTKRKAKGEPVDSKEEEAKTILLSLADQLTSETSSAAAVIDHASIGARAIRSFLSDLALIDDDQSGDGGNSLSQSSIRHATREDMVTISTIHQAKGLEWPVVFVPHMNQGFLPSLYRASKFAPPSSRMRAHAAPELEHVEEERRCAYVAMTRAQEELVISYMSGWCGALKDWFSCQPSEFLIGVIGEKGSLIKANDGIKFKSFAPVDISSHWNNDIQRTDKSGESGLKKAWSLASTSEMGTARAAPSGLPTGFVKASSLVHGSIGANSRM